MDLGDLIGGFRSIRVKFFGQVRGPDPCVHGLLQGVERAAEWIPWGARCQDAGQTWSQEPGMQPGEEESCAHAHRCDAVAMGLLDALDEAAQPEAPRSEEHTSELQS